MITVSTALSDGSSPRCSTGNLSRLRVTELQMGDDNVETVGGREVSQCRAQIAVGF